jgi:hypothetical protein
VRQTDPIYELLYDIRKTAMDHPAFDITLYKSEDIAGLADAGGDVADWTVIAIQANKAMELYMKEDK